MNKIVTSHLEDDMQDLKDNFDIVSAWFPTAKFQDVIQLMIAKRLSEILDELHEMNFREKYSDRAE